MRPELMKAPPPEVSRFLSARRIALVGASTDPKHFSRAVLDGFRNAGYEVVPVHPRAAEIAGLPAYPNLLDIDGPIDAAMVLVAADRAAGVVEDAAAGGVSKVWLHRAAGAGAVSPEAVGKARAAGIDLVEGGCPLMYLPNAGFIHRVHRFFHELGARP